ncbi:pimeloyl-ACP methyl ester carboxylesterase [Streptomyces umbrinus]|uniref:alpha/beta fold hydrolase n=1 Tax=Streptomyces TaxID=1883 RepID=UPI00167EA7C9|nr:alpha/beta hydrolase [Streptomyces umbrinus]MCR3724883.1 pimeloyl-ACP methyl ester carboxylesterase [Streptomyces umbrinus]MCX4563892.1 alpha/beta hydrolase [Streptomyces phaeochromogenes]GHH61008.1 alpha/beta hydrolase [Streptomyces umbrinus]
MSGQKPTVVLVHGAFADSSSWNGVVEKLQSHDYPVVAAANPLRGLTSDGEYVRQLVASIEGPVVLVGHSYGGAVISNAAKGLDNVKALVFVAAFMPDEGESAVDLAGKFPGSTLGEALRPVPITLPDGSRTADLYIERGKFHHQFAADVPEETAAVMAATQRPVTNDALTEAASAPAWKEIPSWVLLATEDLNIPLQTQTFMAERAKATAVAVTASHAVGVSRPGDVARLINEAVEATA